MAMTFLLKGDVCRPGQIHIEKGMTVRQIVDELGGGMAGGKRFKAMQVGGTSGGLLVEEHLDLVFDVKALSSLGIRRGDGVIMVYDEDRCMVDMCYRLMQCTQEEFCGKCVSCREGTRRMDEMMTDLKEYRLTKEFMTRLLDMGEMVSVTAFCALGKGCYSTLQSAYHYFPEEFAAHLDGHCSLCENERRDPILPGSIPFDRKRIVIDPDTCRGCSRCARSCHAEAISGVIKSPFVIDPDKCVKCYNCMDLCAFGAIREVEIDA